MTATISLVAGSQPEGMIAAAARLATSLPSPEAQISVQREALAQLTSGWHDDAAEAALPLSSHLHEPSAAVFVARIRAIRAEGPPGLRPFAT